MSYKLEVQSDLPRAYWRLVETSGTVGADYSGNGLPLTHVGTPGLNMQVMTAAGASILYSGAQYSTATIPAVLFPGTETSSFTIEFWVNAASAPTATRFIAGRSNGGVSLTTSGILFYITDSTAAIQSVLYPISNWDRVLHCVAIFSSGQMTLFVNGDQGNLTNFVGTFAAQTSTFYVGGLTATSATSIFVSDPAIFHYALTQKQILEHYNRGLGVVSSRDIALAAGGNYYNLSDPYATTYFNYLESTTNDFNTGTLTNVTVFNNSISATTNSVAGVRVSPTIDVGVYGTSVGGSRIDWWSTVNGVLVETSVDGGVTWSTAVNHTPITGLTVGTDTTNKYLMVRQTLTTADVVNNPAMLTKLRVVLYATKATNSDRSGLTTTILNPLTLSELNSLPIENIENDGGKMARPGYVIIPTQVDPIYTMEFWVRRDTAYSNGGTLNEYILDTTGAGGGYIRLAPAGTISSTGFTTYVNGFAAALTAANLPVGVFVHVALVATTPITGPIYFNRGATGTTEVSNTTVSNIALYDVTLTANSIARHYGMAVGNASFFTVDPAPSSVVERGYTPYRYAWTTVGGAT